MEENVVVSLDRDTDLHINDYVNCKTLDPAFKDILVVA